jgi:hypothetical protein
MNYFLESDHRVQADRLLVIGEFKGVIAFLIA